MRCGSVWACAVCALAIRAERAEEVRQVAEWWNGQGGELWLVTGTVRHAWTHDLTPTRRGVANLWRAVLGGRAWEEWAARVGLAGWIRALETTHGPNGWHPHTHALMAVRAGIGDGEREALRVELAERWQDAARRQLGDEHAPSLAVGIDIRVLPAGSAEYLSKLSLELTASATKAGRKAAHRGPFQIGADFVAYGDDEDLQLWRRYCDGMKGARFLTWSRGRRDLRKLAGLGAERTDEEIVEGETGEEATVCEIPGAEWDARRDAPGWALAVLEAAERGDVAELRRLIPGARFGADPPPRARPSTSEDVRHGLPDDA